MTMIIVHKSIIAATAIMLVAPAVLAQQDINHHALNMALRYEVNEDGSIRYEDIRNHRHAMLLAYLDAMANTDVDLLPREQQLAYYINVYNATVIDQIVQRWHDGFAPSENDFAMFKEKSVRLFRGKTVSLDEFERQIRVLFKDPRVHAALSKAFKSSPPLRPKPYEAAEVDEQLNEQMRRFVNDKTRNAIDREKKVLRLSRIFEQYADDFGGKDALPAVVGKFVDGGSVEGFSVEFLEFDRALNEPPK
jgi:hypothetical protein